MRSLRRRGLNAETAADLTQDTFLRVLLSPPSSGASNHNPRAYLFQVSRNLSINYQRRQALVPMVDLSDELTAEVADETPSPEAIVHSRQRLRQVEDALNRLPEKARQAFEQHRLGERTIAEIADELGLSVSRTWTLIHEAYRQILASVGDI